MKTLCLFLLSLLCCCRALGAAAADTQPWALHLAYHDATRVVAHGTDLYALLNGNLLQYHTTDGSVVLHDKLGGLSDKGIAFIDWCDEAGCLVIVYANNNVDFLYADGEVANLPQVKDYTETSITVRNLTVSGQWAALATTEGVVRLPSALAMTTGWPPSITATQLLVVPRSIPMILLIMKSSSMFLFVSVKSIRKGGDPCLAQ